MNLDQNNKKANKNLMFSIIHKQVM